MGLNVLAAHGFLQALGSVEDLLGSLQHLVRGFHRSFFWTGLSLAGILLRRNACLWADASRAGPVDRELQLRHVAALHRFEESSFGSASFQRF